MTSSAGKQGVQRCGAATDPAAAVTGRLQDRRGVGAQRHVFTNNEDIHKNENYAGGQRSSRLRLVSIASAKRLPACRDLAVIAAGTVPCNASS